MKKSLLLTLLVAATSIVYGQEVDSKWRGISVAGGMNLSKIDAPGLDYLNAYKSGFTFDVYTGYNFSDNFSVDAGVQYSEVGSKSSFSSSIKTYVNYFSIPIDLNCRIIDNLYGSVGTYFGFQPGNEKYNFGLIGGSGYYFKINTFDIGLRTKLFYEISRFRFTAGYSRGFTNVVKYYDTDGESGIKSKNNVFYFGVGIKIF